MSYVLVMEDVEIVSWEVKSKLTVLKNEVSLSQSLSKCMNYARYHTSLFSLSILRIVRQIKNALKEFNQPVSFDESKITEQNEKPEKQEIPVSETKVISGESKKPSRSPSQLDKYAVDEKAFALIEVTIVEYLIFLGSISK